MKLFSVLMLMVFVGCKKESSKSLPPPIISTPTPEPTEAPTPEPTPPEKVSYSAVKPILDAHCLKCHNTEHPKNGIDVSSEEKFWEFRDFMASEVVMDEMPPKEKLSDEDKELLLRYLNQ